jgi:hypothetical protein
MKNKAGYIGIKEASQLIGVHPDTIRRLIKQHKGSKHIVQGKGTKAPYYISSDWLKELYGLNEPHTAPAAAPNSADDIEPETGSIKAISAVVEALTAQLAAKDKQIEKQQATIDKLAGDYSQLLHQSQQLQGLLLPASSREQQPYEADIKASPAADPKPQESPKSKKPKSRRKTTSKQVKNATKQGNKPAAKTVDKAPSPKKKAQPKKSWWKF